MDVAPILAGDRRALARVLTQIENDTEAGRAALNALFPHSGRAHLVGVTGAPGTGKSSLVNRLALHYRKLDTSLRIAVIAVDPSSPFTGGAVLGDRIRMVELSGDTGVFIRSMASRGSLGGLARTTAGLVRAFDAAGYDIVMIETVGAGQAEVDIARLADTTVVVEAPGLGDDIQAIKAGILEIADVLVINKADRPGVENTERALKSMLQLAHPVRRVFRHHGRTETVAADEPDPDREIWIPPVLKSVASDGTGVPEVAAAIAAHRAYLKDSGDQARRERARLQNELDLRIRDELVERWRLAADNGRYEAMLEKLVAREISPEEATAALTGGGP
ncbi:MAG TPA: methylmalonyl Co-A mutase-associated GTPase MeaB [Anaerolineales bacterium]|nr:methylmalonyl Co-A mutase-associated GTPase MeaB [Anaerolineales bacterium]